MEDFRVRQAIRKEFRRSPALEKIFDDLCDQIDNLRTDNSRLQRTNAEMGAQYHRLRNIEHAAKNFVNDEPFAAPGSAHRILLQTIVDNSRPEDGSS